MQVLVQVVCSKGPSLREAIVSDRKLESFRLSVTEQHHPPLMHIYRCIIRRIAHFEDRAGAFPLPASGQDLAGIFESAERRRSRAAKTRFPGGEAAKNHTQQRNSALRISCIDFWALIHK
jgi:hypothetical protein